MAWVSKIKPRAIYFRYNRHARKVTFKCPVCFMIFDNNNVGRCPHCNTELDFSMYYGG